MPEEKVRVLKEGLPSLGDMETDDLVDYLLRARQTFVEGLTKQSPPLSESTLLTESANFDEAVRRILSEKSKLVQRPAEVKEQTEEAFDPDPAAPSLDDLLSDDRPIEAAQDDSSEDDWGDGWSDDWNATKSEVSEPKEDEPVDIDRAKDELELDELLLEETPLVAEEPVVEHSPLNAPKASLDRRSTQEGFQKGGLDLDSFKPLDPNRGQGDQENWPDILPLSKRGVEPEEAEQEASPQGSSPYVWDDGEKTSGGFLGFIGGLIVLFVYVFLPALALISPLVTPAMAWEELINIGILAGMMLVAVFVFAIFSRNRFRYALYAGVVFALLSYGAHHINYVRTFVDNEQRFLPKITTYLIEGYYQLAEMSELPLKTGVVQLRPNELNYSREQRRALYEKEVDTWLAQ